MENKVRAFLENKERIENAVSSLLKQSRWGFIAGGINGIVWFVLEKLTEIDLDFSGLFRTMIGIFCISIGLCIIAMALKFFMTYHEKGKHEESVH